jgi:hypothetical protein
MFNDCKNTGFREAIAPQLNRNGPTGTVPKTRITIYKSQERLIEGLRQKGGHAVAFDFVI